MNDREPDIRVPVDLTNPGQFFACCGLLELADRLWPGAQAWFDRRGFCLRCDGNLRTLVACLILDPPQQRSFICGTLPVKPIVATQAWRFLSLCNCAKKATQAAKSASRENEALFILRPCLSLKSTLPWLTPTTIRPK
ncbi:MAG: hypothetical protein HY644_02830 [Acidobacteria bacterium]|nr:hypothetical protein [Acidobacteriota bacterium]